MSNKKKVDKMSIKMKFKEISHNTKEDFTFEKVKLIKKGWECISEETYINVYKAQFIKVKGDVYGNIINDIKSTLRDQDLVILLRKTGWVY